MVRRSDSVGRFMVATRDIEPLETILEERPLVMGPCRDGSLVCVECLVSEFGGEGVYASNVSFD